MSEITPVQPLRFACPRCKRPLQSGENMLQCSGCGRTYSVGDGIPDFIPGDAQAKRMARKMDFLAPVYESRIWYPVILNMAGVRGH